MHVVYAVSLCTVDLCAILKLFYIFQEDRLMFAMHLVHGAHPELFQDKVNTY